VAANSNSIPLFQTYLTIRIMVLQTYRSYPTQLLELLWTLRSLIFPLHLTLQHCLLGWCQFETALWALA
jgi:hypothetical protein